MKRYFLFMGDTYYPSRGMGDFFGDFDSVDEAKEHTGKYSTRDFDWVIVYDSVERKEVYHTPDDE
jgi:hypothetical protein